MSERHEIVELTDTVSLGFLATDLVLAMGRRLRDEELTDGDLAVMHGGHDLLQRLGQPQPSLMPVVGPRFLTSDAVDVEVFRAARAQEPDEPVKAVIGRMASLLDRAIAGSLEPSDAEAAGQVRTLFMHLGEITLSRADELLTNPHREQSTWTDPAPTSTS